MAVPDNIFVAKNGVNSLGVILSSGIDLSSLIGGAGDVTKGYLSEYFLPLSGGTLSGTGDKYGTTLLTVDGTLSTSYYGYFSALRVGHVDQDEYDVFPNAYVMLHGNLDSYAEVNVHNENTGTNASADVVATPDNGTDSQFYIDLGINGSNFSSPNFTIVGANDGYLYVQDGQLAVGTSVPTYDLIFFTGGTLAQNQVIRIKDSTQQVLVYTPLSSNNTIYAANGNSDLWNSNYTFNNQNSSYIINSLTDLATSSGSFVISGGPISQGLIQLLQNNNNTIHIDTGLKNTDSPVFSGMTITGNLSVRGDFIYVDTIVTVTSALSVVNQGTGPALTVVQYGATQPIATFIDKEGGAVTIQDGGLIVTDTSDSNKWSNAYTYTNSKSSLIEGDLTNIASVSSNWNKVNQGLFLPLSGGTVTGIVNVYNLLSSTGTGYFSALRIGEGWSDAELEIFPSSIASFHSTTTGRSIVDLRNMSDSPYAVTDLIVTNDIGSESQYFLDIGFTSSNYNVGVPTPNYPVLGPNNAYIYAQDADLLIGVAFPQYKMRFIVGGGEDQYEIFHITTNAMTVNRELSTNNIIRTTNGDSNLWSASYTFVNSNSADWYVKDSVLAANSAKWSSAYTFVNENSSYIFSALSNIASTSANWNNAYSYVNSKSALIEGDLTALASASANWDKVNQGYFLPLSGGNLTGPLSSNSSAIFPSVTGTELITNGSVPFTLGGNIGSPLGNGYWLIRLNNTKSGITYDSGGSVGLTFWNGGVLSFTSVNGISLPYSNMVGWSNSPTAANNNLALSGQSTTNVVEINAGAAGVVRDLKIRDLYANTVYLSSGNSNNWNNAYSYVNGKSALIEGDLTDIAITSAFWDQSYSNFTWLTANSAFNLPTDITASSANWSNAYSYVNSKSALIEGDLTDIAITSAFWDDSYTVVNANSAYWGSGGAGAEGGTLFEATSALIFGNLTNIAQTSATWNAAWSYSISYSAGLIDSRTNVNTNSGFWNTAYSNFTWLTANSAFILPTTITTNSANWSNAYTYVNTKSALIEGDLTDIALTSSFWDDTYTNVSSNSAFWGAGGAGAEGGTLFEATSALIFGDLTNIASTSANWNNAYSYTNSKSALIEGDLTNIAQTSAVWNSTWTNSYTYSAGLINTRTLVNDNSAFWNQSYSNFTWLTANSAYYLPTDITANSGNWNSVFTTVNTNSSDWEIAYDRSTVYANVSGDYALYDWVFTNFIAASGGVLYADFTVVGNFTVYGTISALSGLYFVGESILTSTSSLSIINTGPGPALYIKQAGAVGELATFNDNYGVVMHIETRDDASSGGAVGILTDQPNRALTVKGDISATGSMIASSIDIGLQGTGVLLPDVIAQFTGDTDSYLQINIQNTNPGNFASSDYVATADDGDDTNFYIDLGINSSTYNNPDFNVVGAHDGYLYNAGGNFALGASTPNDLLFFTDGTLLSNIRMVVSANGGVGIGTPYPGSLTERLTINGNVSSNGNISADGGNSVFWNIAYSNMTWLTGNSGTGQSSAVLNTDITANTGKWNSVYATVTAGSAIWDAAWTYSYLYSGGLIDSRTEVNTNSAFWNQSYSYFTWLTANSGSTTSSLPTDVTTNSANWSNAYTYVNTKSALIEGDLTNIAQTSATWNAAWTYDIAYSAGLINSRTLVNNNSAFWDQSYSNFTWLTANSGVYLPTDITTNSANWSNAYSYVNSKSALIEGDLTNIAQTSAVWNSTWTNVYTYSASNLSLANKVTTTSATWDAAWTYSTNYSAGLIAARTNVNNNSAFWNQSYSNFTWLTANSAFSLPTDVTTNSANWSNAYTYVNSKSALIEGDLTNIANTSAVWNSTWTNVYTYSASNLAVANKVTTTSATWDAAWTFSINYSAGLIDSRTEVNTNSANWSNAFTYTNTKSALIEGDLTNIAVTSGTWNSAWTNGFTYSASNLAVATEVTTSSAVWDASWTYSYLYSAGLIDSRTLVNNNSAFWNTAYSNMTWLTANSGTGQTSGGLSTDITANTGKWNSVYATVTAGSAIWDASWLYATTYSASNLAVATDVTTTSATWDAAWTFSINYSAGLIDSRTEVNTNSAFWNQSYTYFTWLTANSGTGQTSGGLSTDITANTGKWNSVYATVTAGSATWDVAWNYVITNSASNTEVDTILTTSSGRWNTAWNYSTTYSASNLAVATEVTTSSAVWNNKATRAFFVENPEAADIFTIWYTPASTTIDQLRVVLQGSATPVLNSIAFYYGANRDIAGTLMTTITSVNNFTTGINLVLTNQPIPANNYVWLSAGSTSGTVSGLHVNFSY